MKFERSPYIMVVTTTATKEDSQRIGKALISSRLAACIHIDRIESIYRWEGRLEVSKEFRLTIKTVRKHFDDVSKKIEALHSYEIPQIVAIPIDGISPKYAKWTNMQLQ